MVGDPPGVDKETLFKKIFGLLSVLPPCCSTGARLAVGWMESPEETRILCQTEVPKSPNALPAQCFEVLKLKLAPNSSVNCGKYINAKRANSLSAWILL